MFKFLSNFFFTASKKKLNKLWKHVEEINQIHETFKPLSNDELREQTQLLKNYIHTQLESYQQKIDELKKVLKTSKKLDLKKKEKQIREMNTLKENKKKQLQHTLNEILPKAFAIVKETARRFASSETLEVIPQAYDQKLAKEVKYVNIQGNKAIWSNTWKVTGKPIVWDMIHYDVQLIGGIILHQGKIAEMATGEGKTLVATLPTFLNALTGNGVHVVTVNDYLAKRDSEWMGPIFEFHGLRVDCIDKHPANTEARRKAYHADITYGTNNEFGFDYLRDNMVEEQNQLVQRLPYYAIIDEVDSILIDDARTPLIISGPSEESDEKEYAQLQPKIYQLYETQKNLVGEFLRKAKEHIQNGNQEEAGLALFRAYRGLPKYKPLIKYLSETGNRQLLNKTQNFYLQANEKLMPEADEPLLFVIDEKYNNVELTEKGIHALSTNSEDKKFFILPNLPSEIDAIENHPQLTDTEKVTQKNNFIKKYNEQLQKIHIIQQLLKAYTIFEIDVEYVVMNNQVKLIDAQTGRIMHGRRYSDGLHQAIEAKENVTIQQPSQTYATITLQNYFRMYDKIAGMTGTAETEANEFWSIYKLEVVVTPTHKKCIRDDREDKIYKTSKEKYKAIIDEIIELKEKNRPVLVGTISVEISELISKMLKLKKIPHQILNAKYHKEEAHIITEAGNNGVVTISTNMAGRGTDIKLNEEARKAGGLAIIGTERHESRRVDRQLRGRSGRQGDVGSSQFFLSLEDQLMRIFGSERIAKIMDRMGLEEGEVIQHRMVTKSIERAQRKVEENNFASRKRLLEYDDVMNVQRNAIYKLRQHALSGENIQFDVLHMLKRVLQNAIKKYQDSHNYQHAKLELIDIFGTDFKITQKDFEQKHTKEAIQKLEEEVYLYYQEKINQMMPEVLQSIKDILDNPEFQNTHKIKLQFGKVENRIHVEFDNLKEIVAEEDVDYLTSTLLQKVTLFVIDKYWKTHLRTLDEVKQYTQNAVYEQKDPLVVYKLEAFEVFQNFVRVMQQEIIGLLFKGNFPENLAELNKTSSRDIKQTNRFSGGREEKAAFLNTLTSQLKQRKTKEDDEILKSKQKPIHKIQIPTRNERVTVEYQDGTIKKDVKFKKIEEDLQNNLCKIILSK